MNIEEAAARLKVPAAEVTGVERTREGTVVTTRDGQSYIVTTDDQLCWYGTKAPNAVLQLWVPGSGEAVAVKLPPKKS